jgi:hypothetical protein
VLPILHIVFPEKFDQGFLLGFNGAMINSNWYERQLLTSDAVEKETPQCNKEEDKTERVL